MPFKRDLALQIISLSKQSFTMQYRFIHAQVKYEFCISFLYFWIDLLDLNQPFNWRTEIWEPSKWNLYEGVNLVYNLW